MAHSTALPHSQRRATPACSAGLGARLAPLTPAQVLVLSDAARRSDGGVILPERLKGKAAEKLVQALTEKGFVREVRAKADLPVWRRDGETGRYALVLTRLGRAAVPSEDPAPEQAGVGGTRAPEALPGANAVLATASDPLPRTAEAGSHGSGMGENPAPNPKKDAGLAPRPGSKLGAVIALLWDSPGLVDTDEALAKGVPQWPRHIPRMRRSSGARWSSWSEPAVIPPISPVSSSPPPRRSATGWRPPTGRRVARYLLLRVLAYRIQADAFGALRADVRRMLDGLAAASGREGLDPAQQPSPALVRATPKPGTVLAREWQGRMEQVMVLKDGFAWRGATYASLSAVALAMTGTKWNGHRFFGLRDKAGPSPEAEPPPPPARAIGPARVGSTGMRTGRCGAPEPRRGAGQKGAEPGSNPQRRSAGSRADR